LPVCENAGYLASAIEGIIMKSARKSPLKKVFSSLLLSWNQRENRREMPWKGEKDPYKIWLSEIILQQTRVEQGLAYYKRFITAFPNIQCLAEAPEDKVFKLWEGLGYYTRCRNLIATARYISNELDGRFPDTYEGIKSLKGIGPYTAAAISSFAFNLPYAVVDGNVFRVLARVFDNPTPIDSTEGKKYFASLAGELLDSSQPGLYNQSIMDFGAVICKPASPLCNNCVFSEHCGALRQGRVNELPVKEKKILIKKRWFYYLHMDYNGATIIRQRTSKDIWQQLFEFPLVESTTEVSPDTIINLSVKEGMLPSSGHELISVSGPFTQKLTHQTINGRFLRVKINDTKFQPRDWKLVHKELLRDFAFPQLINQYLGKKEA